MADGTESQAGQNCHDKAAAEFGGRLLISNHEMRRYLPTGAVPSQDDGVHKRWLALHPDGRRVARQDFPGARALPAGYHQT